MSPLQKCNGGLKYENFIFTWKYIVWPIKWLEILPGIWNWNQNFKIDGSLRSMYKYIRKWTYFSDFCENFQGKFFFKGQYQFFTINYTYLYKSLLLRIFLNPYPIKPHCACFAWLWNKVRGSRPEICPLRPEIYPLRPEICPLRPWICEGRLQAWEDRFQVCEDRFQAWEDRFQI